MTRAPLPVDPRVPEVVEAVRSRGACVVTAPPGAGKTTRIPPALTALGPVIVLQPRRVATRALARRIATEQGWRLGGEVGWQVRGEKRFGPDTRLLVATEGILTARLQADPLLSGFRCAVVDEFHERSQHADLALALAKQAAHARGDLGLVVMSATLDADAVARWLGGCPVVAVDARAHPVEVAWAPERSVADAVREALGETRGHVLAFLPGVAEIGRAERELRGCGADVRPLHGRLTSREQDDALAPGGPRRVVLATNVAETSLTVEGVEAVVDSGLHRVLRFDPARGLDRLETERVPEDAATQRTGRAGRTGPGRCVRLWHAAERLRPHREPELERVDLSGPVLEVLAWGGDPRRFDWFEAPPVERVDHALDLLGRLGAVAGGRLTEAGQALRRLPLHPRLARVLVGAGGSRAATLACALLTERLPPRAGDLDTDCDLLPLIDDARALPPPIRAAATELREAARRVLGEPERDDETRLRRALFAGFPDRLARRREPGGDRFVLASGHGARLDPACAVRRAGLVVALDLAAGPRGPGAEARIRAASAVDPEWVVATHADTECRFDAEAGAVRAWEREWYDALPLRERPVPPDAARAAQLLAAERRRRGLSAASASWLRRAAFAGEDVDLDALLEAAYAGRDRLVDVEVGEWLDPALRAAIERRAPEALEVPSGRRLRLDYRDDGEVELRVKLQELFGLGETPRVGGRPVLLSLLAPNGLPVQTTRDLRSFWENGYPEVRRELRGRYPKHPWPEDPWSAEPTARAKPRRR